MSETTETVTPKRRSAKDAAVERAKAIAAKYGISEAEVLADLFPGKEEAEQSPRVKNLDALIAANRGALTILAEAVVRAGGGDSRKLGIFVGHKGDGEPRVKKVLGRGGRAK